MKNPGYLGADGPQYVGGAFEEGGAYCEANPENCEEGGPKPGNIFFGATPQDDSFCADNPESPECKGGNAQAVYTFFHVYDENVLGNEWEPVDCNDIQMILCAVVVTFSMNM